MNQQFTFNAKIGATVTNSTSINTPEKIYTLQPYYGYLKTETESDLVISTNKNEKMRITADGSIGIQKTIPTSCLELDTNYGKVVQVNTSTSNYQINPVISKLEGGGYVVVWESNSTDGSSYGIYAQKYMTDGNVSGDNFRVNVITTNNQSFPAVAGRKIVEALITQSFGAIIVMERLIMIFICKYTKIIILY